MFRLKYQLIFLLLITSGFFFFAQAQPFTPYYSRAFLFAPPGAFENGLLGYVNPANSQMISQFEARYLWTTDRTDWWSLRDWGFFAAVQGFSFGMVRQRFGDLKVTDYKISFAQGNRQIAFGVGYGWSGGNADALGREKLLTAGLLFRPVKYISLGATGNFSTVSNSNEGIFEVALRPLGNPRLTFFGDVAIRREQKISDAPWSLGMAVSPVSGLNIVGRYFENKSFTVGLSISFGYTRLSGQSHFDSNGNRTFNTYGIRAGAYTRNFLTPLLESRKYYLEMKLKGKVDYQKYILFDEGTHRFMDLIEKIQTAARDPRISVLALNLSSLRILPEHAWEIRQELQKARDAGKKVVIFIDNSEMTLYHLASVADVIMMDPDGTLFLPGYVMGRTFLKGTLEKLGLGFDEWRFFKYKSAVEVLSREKMSEADREQRQAYIDDQYQLVRQEVSAARPFDEQQFDQYINQEVIFSPADAIKAGLVDTLVRWDKVGEVIKNLTGEKKKKLPHQLLLDYKAVNENWGNPPQIALVYGLGVCALDEGIKARWLSGVLRKLAKNKQVKAVVFRVDSPGGDGMASDMVAEALREISKKKPVIVSQGQVAGSGGYWISMYGDTIVAGPNTVTGSIGVIGGWLYDRGFSSKLGMTADHVQVGKHADLGFGVQLPYLGITVPARNLTPEERQRMEKFIKQFYQEFIKKVAEGRGLSVAEVDSIGQGHFYSGVDGKSIGLVDEIGGLSLAIQLAKEKAGIPEKEIVDIIEIPKYKGFIKLPSFSPVGMRAEMENSSVIQFLKFYSRNQRKPLPMLLPGDYPTLN